MRRILRRLRRGGEALLQAGARRWLRAVLARRLRPWPARELARPAVVFAPHQDDEVLGCGGTIVRKRRAGAPVTVVFMTDGSASHPPHLMPPEETKRLRAAEALACCQLLGVAREHVLFLDFKDGQLGSFHEAVVRRVAELLRRLGPADVFIPHYHDGSPDHLATTRAVLAALRAHEPALTVYP
jgi:LmbE family N-acetylglucosaminyl deacetylase